MYPRLKLKCLTSHFLGRLIQGDLIEEMTWNIFVDAFKFFSTFIIIKQLSYDLHHDDFEMFTVRAVYHVACSSYGCQDVSLFLVLLCFYQTYNLFFTQDTCIVKIGMSIQTVRAPSISAVRGFHVGRITS